MSQLTFTCSTVQLSFKALKTSRHAVMHLEIERGGFFCDILIPHSSSSYHLRRVWEGRVGDCAWVCLVVHLLQKFGNDDDDGDGEDGDGHDDEDGVDNEDHLHQVGVDREV